ncbi:MAG: hypothetical protein ACYTEK_07195, partial [Planctomycetota bacterium]
MSKIDENEIRERLRLLSQVGPAQEATDRAIRQVRGDLMAKKGRRVGLAPPSLIGGLKPILRLMKLAAAAVLLIGAGFLAGRLSGPEPIDIEVLRADLASSLRSSFEPAIRQSLLKEMDNRWQAAFEAGYVQLKDELRQQVRRDLIEFAAQSLAASSMQTERQLRELIQLIEAARIQDRRRIEEALEHMESQFGNGL